MYTLFNPTAYDLAFDIDTPKYPKRKWYLGPGDTKNFPDEVAKVWLERFAFLKVLKKDDVDPGAKRFQPPKDLSKVEDAIVDEIERDRRVKHPTTNSEVVESHGFGPSSKFNESGIGNVEVGLPRTIKQMKEGKLVHVDSDGVDWYGNGIEADKVTGKLGIDSE